MWGTGRASAASRGLMPLNVLPTVSRSSMRSTKAVQATLATFVIANRARVWLVEAQPHRARRTSASLTISLNSGRYGAVGQSFSLKILRERVVVSLARGGGLTVKMGELLALPREPSSRRRIASCGGVVRPCAILVVRNSEVRREAVREASVPTQPAPSALVPYRPSRGNRAIDERRVGVTICRSTASLTTAIVRMEQMRTL